MRSILFKNIYFIIISSIIFIVSCDDTLVTDDIDKRTMPDKNISYSADLAPVFQLKCGTSNCHNYQTSKGGINMMDWNSFTRVPYIISGAPDESTMVLMVEGSILPTMPPLNTNLPLTDAQIKGLRTWILEGAKNN